MNKDKCALEVGAYGAFCKCTAVGLSAVEHRVMPTSPEEFECELFKLINDHVKRGLKKQDLVAKMKWATGNCEFA